MTTPIRRSKKGNTVTLEIGVWWNARERTIHIASNQSKTLIATVSNDPTSVRRYHPKLFRELAKILKDNGAPGPE